MVKRIILESVQPGDILLTARPGLISGSIRFATRGIVSHAMICVQYGSVIDSTKDGVQARNLQREFFADDEQVFHFRLREPASHDLIDRIVNHARAEIGTRYSVSEAARLVVALRRPRSRRQFCSRLVARVYGKAGIELVDDADYCSPEDLRRSPMLTELPIRTEAVSEDEIGRWKSGYDPIAETHGAHNAILDVARSFEPTVETFEDLFSLLIERPEIDETMAEAFEDSGYLHLWRGETDAFPWRYDHDIIVTMTSALQTAALRQYCIATIGEAYTGGLRFAINLVQLRGLHDRYPRRTFRMEIDLYEQLVRNDEMRREVAYRWLRDHYPDDLHRHFQRIEPHGDRWYAIVDLVEPRLAALSRHAVSSEGSPDVCSSCGDAPATAYRVVNGAETMPGVPSLRLCGDCIVIRRDMGNVLEPFPPKG